ncbi:MAG: hypothetical protein FWH50_03120, partial [Coriobacteriia bacterium]|nr:hypothetical protein [Coriobacteriia bacterium]
MLKLMRFVKPFVPAIGLAVLMLFAQAICELYLPNLMGDIVNVGIQQGGIEGSTPPALTEEAYEFVQAFMDEGDKALMDESYVLVDGNGNDSSGKPYTKQWPDAADRNIYVLGKVSDEALARLDEAFGTTTWTILNYLGIMQSALEEGGGPGLEMPGGTGSPAPDVVEVVGDEAEAPEMDMSGLDIAAMYDLLPLIKTLPAEWMEQARAEAINMSPETRSQSATMLSAAFYREL